MRKLIALLFALALLCATLPSCAGRSSTGDGNTAAPHESPNTTERSTSEPAQPAGSQEPDQEDPLTKKVLSDWFDYLLASEYMYGDMLWAFSYVEKFQENRTWENLQMARMAVWTAERYISEREKPEATVTSEEYDSLIRNGKDLAFVQPELNAFAEHKEFALNNCKQMIFGTGEDVFWKYSLSAAMSCAEVSARWHQCELGSLAVTTDYLVLVLGKSDETERFDAFVEEHCPRIAAVRVSGSDKDALHKRQEDYLAEMESVRGDEDINLSQYQASLDLYRDVLLTGNDDVLLQNLVEIENIPLMFPDPYWGEENTEDFFYYWTAGDGSHAYPKEGQEFERIADGFMAEYDGVTEEDFLAYRDLLERSGYTSGVLLDEGDSLGMTYSFRDAEIRFLWSNDTAVVSVEGNVCFAPIWYISALTTNSSQR